MYGGQFVEHLSKTNAAEQCDLIRDHDSFKCGRSQTAVKLELLFNKPAARHTALVCSLFVGPE